MQKYEFYNKTKTAQKARNTPKTQLCGKSGNQFQKILQYSMHPRFHIENSFSVQNKRKQELSGGFGWTSPAIANAIQLLGGSRSSGEGKSSVKFAIQRAADYF